MEAILPVMIFVAGLGLSPTLAAQPSQRATAAESTFWSGPPPSRAVRLKQATEWRDGFRKLDQQIPTLSPSQAGWLKREYDDQVASNGGRFTPRAIEVMKSREYQLRVAREGLDPILTTLDALVASEPRALQDEVRDWTRLAALMMEQGLWQSVTTLVKEGLIKPEINGISAYYGENHAGWAQGVLNRVVIPFLQKTLR